MKVLWICNLILPEFAAVYNVSKTQLCGWMSGMLYEIEKIPHINIAFAFPIIDERRYKDGVWKSHPYYSFPHSQGDEPRYGEKIRFAEIFRDFRPDIIHIWGTEFPHTYSAVCAASEVGIVDRVVIHIQGLVSEIANYYLRGLAETIKEREILNAIVKEKESFENRGIYEKKAIQIVKHIIGRTTWDKACITWINPKCNYHYCGEVLRDSFYKYANAWNFENCEKYTIFISQGYYPIKGMHYFLEALHHLKNKYPNIKVRISGKNMFESDELYPYAKCIKELILQYKLDDNIEFLGYLDAENMAIMYQKANAYVLPSVIENSPNSLCEAMLVGVPVVAAAVGGVPDIITSVQEGYIYQYDNPKMLSYFLDMIFSQKTNLKLLSKNETSKILKYNSINNGVERLMTIYSCIRNNG